MRCLFGTECLRTEVTRTLRRERARGRQRKRGKEAAINRNERMNGVSRNHVGPPNLSRFYKQAPCTIPSAISAELCSAFAEIDTNTRRARRGAPHGFLSLSLPSSVSCSRVRRKHNDELRIYKTARTAPHLQLRRRIYVDGR